MSVAQHRKHELDALKALFGIRQHTLEALFATLHESGSKVTATAAIGETIFEVSERLNQTMGGFNFRRELQTSRTTEEKRRFPRAENSLRVHAMGHVDELNSHIGVLLCEDMPAGIRTLLVEIQHQLFNLGGELSIPGFELLKAEAVLALDEALAHHNAALPRLQEFILPAGTRAASQAHICRTVARRAERAVVALGNEEALNDVPRQYLNRLSDLMFVLARVLNRMDGGDDVYWKSERLAQQNATE